MILLQTSSLKIINLWETVFKNIEGTLLLKDVRKLVKEVFPEDSKYMTIHRAKGTEHKVGLVNLEPFREESKLFSPVDVLCYPEVLSNDANYSET